MADKRRCGKCFYKGFAGRYVVCDYILIEKHSRGCPVGADCTQFRPRRTTKKTNDSLFPQSNSYQRSDTHAS